jgi:histidinol-phosphate aminotransferase
MRGRRHIKLNSNENMFLPRELLTSIALEVSQQVDYRRYPQDELFDLKTSIGRYLNLPSDFILVGCGSDQLIDFISRTFLSRRIGATSISPTFSFYSITCGLAESKYSKVDLNQDFSLNVDEILKVSQNARVCFLASPNNPTANQFDIESVKILIESFPGIVVIDEAYVEYGKYDISQWVKEYDNLIVLRTFSKAFGLAALRVGYMVSNTLITEPFSRKIQYPFPVSSFSLKMAIELLRRYSLVHESVEHLMKERQFLINEFINIGLQNVFPSDSNFILINIGKDVVKVHKKLLKEGVFLRYIGKVLEFEGCIRCTVGTPEMNEILLDKMRINL